MSQELTLILDSISEQVLPFHFRSCLGPYRHLSGTLPSRQGLDELRLSGSEQPSPSELNGTIKNLAPEVAIFDLREESHGFVDNHPVSWYGQRNWANLGKSLPEILADENSRLKALALPGTLRLTRPKLKDDNGNISEAEASEVYCRSSLNEPDAAKSAGLAYYRIPATDHSPPKPSDVDMFLAILRDIPPDLWLHFHCHAGDGRTTTFMLICDMLRNARELPVQELAQRQYLIGGVDLLHVAHLSWKGPLYYERAKFVERFHGFARMGNWREMDWSQYLAQNS